MCHFPMGREENDKNKYSLVPQWPHFKKHLFIDGRNIKVIWHALRELCVKPVKKDRKTSVSQRVGTRYEKHICEKNKQALPKKPCTSS